MVAESTDSITDCAEHHVTEMICKINPGKPYIKKIKDIDFFCWIIIINLISLKNSSKTFEGQLHLQRCCFLGYAFDINTRFEKRRW